MNLVTVLIAFLQPAAHAISNIFDAYVTGHMFKRISTAIFYANLTNVIGLLFLPLIGQIHLPSTSMCFWIVLLAMINIGYMFPYYAALRKTDTSVVASMFSINKIFIPMWAYLIVGEIVHTSQYIGFAIIILFSVILNIKPGHKLKINSGFYLMLLVGFILSLEPSFYKALLQDFDWVSAAFWGALVSFIIQFFMIFIKSWRQDIIKGFPTYRRYFGTFFLMETFDQIGTFTPVFALSVLPVIVNTSIASVQPIFVALFISILAKVFKNKFHEDISKGAIIKKVFCFIMIGVGVVMSIII